MCRAMCDGFLRKSFYEFVFIAARQADTFCASVYLLRVAGFVRVRGKTNRLLFKLRKFLRKARVR